MKIMLNKRSKKKTQKEKHNKIKQGIPIYLDLTKTNNNNNNNKIPQSSNFYSKLNRHLNFQRISIHIFGDFNNTCKENNLLH